MAEQAEIRVVISGTAAQLRAALGDAVGAVGGLSAAIKTVPRDVKIDVKAETAVALARVKELTAMSKLVPKRIRIVAEADTGIASAKLRLLQAQARDTESAIARAQLGGLLTGAGGGAGGAGLLAGITGGGAAAAAGGGAAAGLLGVAGSAGQGILGAGAIGTAGAGAIGIGGLLPLLTLVKPALGDVQKLSAALTNLRQVQELYGKNQPALVAAQNNYNAAVAAFGPSSAAAVNAHAKLVLAQHATANSAPQVVKAQMAVNKLMLESSPGARSLATAFSGLDSAMNDAGLKIIPQLSGVLRPLISTFTKDLLPTLVQMAKIDLRGLQVAIKPLLDIARSPEFKSLLLQMAQNFAHLMPLVFRGLGDVMQIFLRVAKDAGPAMLSMAGSVTGLLDRAVAFTKSPAFGPFINQIVGQFKSWLGLAKSIVTVVYNVLNAGSAQGGQSLVIALTHLVDSIGPGLVVLFKGLAIIIQGIATAIGAISSPLPGVLKLIPLLAVGGAVLWSWGLLKAAVIAVGTEAKLSALAMLGLGAPAAAGAGAAGAAGRTAAAAASVQAAAGGAGAAGAGAGAAAGFSSLILPVAAVAGITYGLLQLSHAVNGDGGVNAALKKMQQQMRDALAAGDTGKLSALSQAAQHTADKIGFLGGHGSSDFHLLSTEAAKAALDVKYGLGVMDAAVKKSGDTWGATFASISGTTGSVMAQVKAQLNTDIHAISVNLGTGTRQGQLALASTFAGAMQAVISNMDQGVLGTSQGMHAINELLARALKALGISKVPELAGSFVAKVGAQATASLPAFYSGGKVNQPGYFAGEEAPHHPEYILATNPAYRQRNLGLWAAAGSELGVPGFAKGGIALPLPRGSWYGSPSVDMGVDYPAPAGTPEYAMGPGRITGEGIQGFGPWAPTLAVTGGPLAGRNIYYGHAGPNVAHTGQTVAAGQQITQVGAGILGISTGPHLEIGFGPPYGRGDSMLALIQSLLSGATPSAAQIGGGGAPGLAAAIWQSIKAPKWAGPGGLIGQIGRGALAKATAAANKYGAARAGSAGGAPGSLAGFTSGGGGSSANQTLGHRMMLAFGLPESEWPSLQTLWQHESGWSTTAGSPGAAYGIPQSDPGSKMAASGSDWLTNPATQIKWGLGYIRGRYGTPSKAWAGWYGGNFAGTPYAGSYGYAKGGRHGGRGIPGFAAGGLHTTRPGVVHTHPTVIPRGARAGSQPPKAVKVKHPATPKIHVPGAISNALKRLLPADVVALDTTAAAYAQRQNDLQSAESQLDFTQGLPPYPAQALVSLTDADVTAMDPSGTLGYQVGDQLLNQSGMTVGRFFGPAGIQGGSWVPGIDQRQGQIAAQLSNLYGQQSAITSAGRFYGRAADRDGQASRQREQRRNRVLAFLRKQVVHAKTIQAELAAATTGNLKANLAKALSKQAVTQRLGALRQNKQHIQSELLAEKASQAQLSSLERNPAHTSALQAQLQAATDAIAVETQLGAGVGASAAVQAAKSAVYRNSLKSRLKAYATVDTTLGGKPYEVGSGGIIGELQKQIDAIDANRNAETANRTGLAPALQQVNDKITTYLIESSGLPGIRSIQVRPPGAGSAASGQTAAQMLALVQTQLQQTAQALAVSQSQFGVFSGFAPLLGGRMLGSFQTGIDRVPQTGPYLLHRDEMVIPDPYGPQGNRAASVQTAQGPVQIDLHFDGDSGKLVRLVRAEMNQHALQVVSDHAGQRARLLAGVRRA